jgi:hypothetical protein
MSDLSREKYKYNKYKLKYFKLKNKVGGANELECESYIVKIKEQMYKYIFDVYPDITSFDKNIDEYDEIAEETLVKKITKPYYIKKDANPKDKICGDTVNDIFEYNETEITDFFNNYFIQLNDMIDSSNKIFDICAKHESLKHNNSCHKKYLCDYIKKYTENVIKWMKTHSLLYIEKKHPESCKYCHACDYKKFFIEQYEIIELYYDLYKDECKLSCDAEVKKKNMDCILSNQYVHKTGKSVEHCPQCNLHTIIE